MKLRVLLGLLCLVAPGWIGCIDGDETHTICLSSCHDSVAFALATPLPGREIAISVGFPDGSVESINCQPGDGSVACIPVVSRVQLTFAADGALQSLGVSQPPSGTYAVQIEVDGAPAAAGAFSVQGPPPPRPSGGPCGPEDGFAPGPTCAGTQTFTIAD